MSGSKSKGSLIQNRYQIVATLGQGGMGVTYAAIDLTNSKSVALKVVSFRQTSDWKTLQLFEREARILKNLRHLRVPSYLDYFKIDTQVDCQFFLVRELIEGQSLAEFSLQTIINEDAAIKIAVAVLEVLVYLHSFTPPVIHRDIKPENILIDRQNKVYLVDFGAAQNTLRNTHSFVSTFVGTLGYMPPEQLTGHVVAASDLYSLGCTIVFLLTKRPPNELPVSRLKIDFRGAANLSDKFAAWLEKMLEPFCEDRYESAAEALKHLLQIKKSFETDSKGICCRNNLETSSMHFKFFDEQEEILGSNSKLEEVKTFARVDKNSIVFQCKDTHDFHPYRLTVEEKNFILELKCFETIYLVKGLLKNLTVFVVEKQDSSSENLYNIITDGSCYYKFGSKLNFQQRITLVETINSFLEKHKNN